jgi:hypothetical protein
MAHTWWYNTVSGLVVHESNGLLQAALSRTPTWHGFDSKAAAEAYKKAHPASAPIIGDAANKLNPVSELKDVTGFLSLLTERAVWLRVAEVIIGAALIVVGLVRLAPPQITSVAKVAALL